MVRTLFASKAKIIIVALHRFTAVIRGVHNSKLRKVASKAQSVGITSHAVIGTVRTGFLR